MFPGFNKGKRNSISNGDWDRDGVRNRKDCNALDWKKQDGGEPLSETMIVGVTLDNPKGETLYKYRGMWLSKLDIELMKIEEKNKK